MRVHFPREAGTALISTLFVTVSLIAISATYLSVSYTEYESGLRETAAVRARCAAEEALQLAVAELKANVDAGGDGLGSFKSTGPDGRVLRSRAMPLGGDLYSVLAVGTVTRASASYDGLVEVIPVAGLPYNARAAITAEGQVTTGGNISIDGRDWNPTGTSIVGPGVFGISSMSTITRTGSSTVGGNGFAPSTLLNPLTIQPLAQWKDVIDNDGDGSIDEEPWDGIDNDGDGLVDEDTNDYPDSPDLLFNLSPGTLKSYAQSQGTYFSTKTAYEAYRTANGGNLPGGKIFYLEFDSWLPANLSSTMNATPSILIHHNSSGNAVMKNVHYEFKGLILGDLVQHINGDFRLLGGFMSFSNKSIGNQYGNGNAQIRYSSAVLANLPSASSARRARILSVKRSGVEEM